MSTELEILNSFRYKIAIAETFEEIKNLEDVTAAAAEFAKRQKLSKNKQDDIGIMRIELEEKKGKWLKDNFPHGATKDNPRNTKVKVADDNLKNKMPATKEESAQARLLSKEQEIKEEVIEEIKNSDKIISPKIVASEVRKKKKQKVLEKKKREYSEKVETSKTIDSNNKIDIHTTNKKFRIIYADPPWRYDLEQTSPQLGGAIKHYDSMSIDELCDLPVSEITEKDSVLFLWVTSPKLTLFLSLMQSWGFEYKTSFIWDKVKHNMGHYNSVRHEFLLIGGKGSSTPDIKKLHDSVQVIERSETHSEKPIEFMNIIDELYVHGERIELFCRQPKKKGWYFWGNEV